MSTLIIQEVIVGALTGPHETSPINVQSFIAGDQSAIKSADGSFSLDIKFSTSAGATISVYAWWSNGEDFDANTAVTIVTGMAAGRRGYAFSIPVCKAFKLYIVPTANCTIDKCIIAMA